jgi:hypothetical protein
LTTAHAASISHDAGVYRAWTDAKQTGIGKPVIGADHPVVPAGMAWDFDLSKIATAADVFSGPLRAGP